MNSPHPIQSDSTKPTEERLRLLEDALARLWDRVWWMQLPLERRAAYQAHGFNAPIVSFYNDGGPEWP
jgi:hypothetical protein